MYASRRLSCPSFFHPSTNRRRYRLLSNGLIGEPCGVPRPSSRFRVLRRLFPRSSVSSTGASSHILIRWSMFPSTTRRATDFISSECGRVWWVGTGLEVDLLCPSPLAEPVEQISRNGLPRLHSLDSCQTVGWSVETAYGSWNQG